MSISKSGKSLNHYYINELQPEICFVQENNNVDFLLDASSEDMNATFEEDDTEGSDFGIELQEVEDFDFDTEEFF